MMELLEFENERAYIRAQQETRRRRDILSVKRNKPLRTFYEPDHIRQIVELMGVSTRHVICHGARCGGEAGVFRSLLPLATVIATDLFPAGEGVVEWDFRKPKPDWVGKFDVVYSNSLDHSDSPEQTVRVWLDQLADNGRVCVEWTVWHDMRVRLGDCFRARFHEYVKLFEDAGTVHNILYAKPCRLLLVSGK